MSPKIKFIQKDCNPEAANDRSLPCTSYLVEYISDGVTKWDLVICTKKVDIFDYYWDLYREDLIGFKQSEGRTNPKLWNPPGTKKKK